MTVMQKNRHLVSPQRQHGVVLIFSLVILMVLTILGISSMNTANLQTIMAGNSQYQTTALNTAEGALAAAEATIDAVVAGAPLPAGGGYYDVAAGAAEIDPLTFDWSDSNNANYFTDGNSKTVVEYTGPETPPPSSFRYLNSVPIAGDQVYVFRTTVRSTSSRGAVRLIQGVYLTLTAP